MGCGWPVEAGGYEGRDTGAEDKMGLDCRLTGVLETKETNPGLE